MKLFVALAICCGSIYHAYGYSGAYITSSLISPMNYSEAQLFCLRNFGTHLATITSTEENAFVRDAATAAGIATTEDLWIGLNDLSEEGVWDTWNDGTLISDTNYENWGEGQPRNHLGSEHCAELRTSQGDVWNDQRCDGVQYPVCNCELYVGEAGTSTYFSAAEQYCEDTYSTNLATIINDTQNQCAYQTAWQLGFTNTWIGVYRFESDDIDTWRSVLTNDVVSYTNFGTGEPNNNGNQFCIQLYSSDEWDDDQCFDNHQFLCNKYDQYIVPTWAGKQTYDDAETYCQTQYKTNLATITSEFENTLLRQKVEDAGIILEEVWIGLNDYDEDRIFDYWNDGTSVSFTQWYPGQPNDAGDGQDCVLQQLDNNVFGWGDGYCTYELYFVCNFHGYAPTLNPSELPTHFPTKPPTSDPSQFPTSFPTYLPSNFPTDHPTSLFSTESSTTATSISRFSYSTTQSKLISDSMTSKTSTTAQDSTMASPDDAENDGLEWILESTNVWMIGGIIVLLLVCILCALVYLIYLKKKKQSENSETNWQSNLSPSAAASVSYSDEKNKKKRVAAISASRVVLSSPGSQEIPGSPSSAQQNIDDFKQVEIAPVGLTKTDSGKQEFLTSDPVEGVGDGEKGNETDDGLYISGDTSK